MREQCLHNASFTDIYLKVNHTQAVKLHSYGENSHQVPYYIDLQRLPLVLNLCPGFYDNINRT